jgi:catechol 2,3-dioxygenase-like lactoylglutathione lyase family enzyme
MTGGQTPGRGQPGRAAALDAVARRRDPPAVTLADARIGANVPVSDLDGAIAFYEGKLGLELFERGEEAPYARFRGFGETKLGIYQSGTAGQAKHTLVSFVVDDVRRVVGALQADGVVFEEYDLPGMKTENGVATVGDTRAAWLKDPDGNILEIVGA